MSEELLYLAYGSNLHPHRLGARTPSATPLGTVKLPGRRLAFHKRSRDGSGKADLIADPKALAYGAVYRLHTREKPILDRVEGVGYGYEEHTLELDGYGEVFLYVADPDYISPSLAPYRWYLRFVIEGAGWHGLPEPYVAFLRAVGARDDPDRHRAEENARILAGRPEMS